MENHEKNDKKETQSQISDIGAVDIAQYQVIKTENIKESSYDQKSVEKRENSQAEKFIIQDQVKLMEGPIFPENQQTGKLSDLNFINFIIYQNSLNLLKVFLYLFTLPFSSEKMYYLQKH